MIQSGITSKFPEYVSRKNDTQLFINPIIDSTGWIQNYSKPIIKKEKESGTEKKTKNYLELSPKLEIKDKKKRRLEQNRVSACISRKRKKAYIESLINEVKQLKAELNYYKMYFSDHMTYHSDLVLKMKEDIEKSIKQLNLEIQKGNISHAKIELDNISSKYGVDSYERKKILENLTNGIIETVLPKSYVYLLQSAKKICDHNVIKYQDDLLNLLKDNEKHIIYETKNALEVFGKTLKKAVIGLIQAKDKLCNEVKKLDNFIKENIKSKVSIDSIGKFLQWLKEGNEISEFTLFELEKIHFPDFDIRCQKEIGSYVIKKEEL